MVDLLRGRPGGLEPLRPPGGRVRERGRRRGRHGARHRGAGRGTGSAVIVLALAAVLALAPGCASGGPQDGSADADGDRPEADRVEEGAHEGRRAASDRMVEEGRAALEDGRLGEAVSGLERAVRVDPSNGRAYLALAEVRIAEGRPRAAEGLLERALTLLEADSPSAARADSLREELEPGPD